MRPKARVARPPRLLRFCAPPRDARSGAALLQRIIESLLLLVRGVVQLAGACQQRRIAGAVLHVARYQHGRDPQLLARVDPLVAAHARVEVAEGAEPPVAVLARSETDRQLAGRGGLPYRAPCRATFQP